MNEVKRVGYINSGATGAWGTLDWDGEKFFIRNVRQVSDAQWAADVQLETGETFVNKANKVCKRYKTIGAVLMTPDAGTLVMEPTAGKRVRETFTVSVHEGKAGEYKRLTFGESNPYLDMLTGNTPVDTTPATAAELPEVPDTLPF